MAVIRRFREHVPVLGERIFLADGVAVVGDVVIGDDTNIWYGTVIRGDVGKVRIGARVNVQDLSCIHMTTGISDAIIMDEASIGHGVIVHGAIVESGALVGMGCVLMDNARIGEEALIGAGSLVTSGTHIPPRTLAHGRPARVIRDLTPEECGAGRATSKKYVGLARFHQQADLDLLRQPPPTK